MIMVFWTWAKGLEDRFDGHNRRNLRDIIIRKEENDVLLRVQSTETNIVENEEDAESIHKAERYYVLDHHEDKPGYNASSDDKSSLKVMARIPTCAIFHKLTTGRGVPHTFISKQRSIQMIISSLLNFQYSRLLPPVACTSPSRRKYYKTFREKSV